MTLPTTSSRERMVFFVLWCWPLVWTGRYVGASITNSSILPTPPMGFNNWARFQCNLSESLFTATADTMASNGLLAAGYNRLNMDDCWMQYSRAPNSTLQWNNTLFPHGIPWLSKYVKSRGFQLGIYGDAGNMTCGGYPGSLGYEELDAATFASWGIDYLKLDGCNLNASSGQTPEQRYKEVYGKWHSIFSNSTSPLIFSESAPAYFSGGTDFPPQVNLSDWYRVTLWSSQYGELARHSNDIAVYGGYEPNQYWQSIMTNYDFEIRLARYQSPGFYNDPDFLIADWPWLTLDEKKSQFALWASFSAPLIISANISSLTGEVVEYLTNRDIIAVDQDPLGLQATLVRQDGNFDVLTKNLANGDRLLTVLNRGPKSSNTTVSINEIGLMTGPEYQAKDLWTNTSRAFQNNLLIGLPSHATAIFRISNNEQPALPVGMIFNTASMQCLTGSKSGELSFQKCSGVGSQLWRSQLLEGQASTFELSNTNYCLSIKEVKGMVYQVPFTERPAIKDKETYLSIQGCSINDVRQKWRYHVDGNLVSSSNSLCLTQDGSKVKISTCGEELDSQVFGLPSGVVVVR